MPVSKQVRTRQNRQKERIVVARADRRRHQRRRRIIGSVSAVLIFGVLVAVVLSLQPSTTSSSSPPPPTTSPPTTVASVKGKPCVGLKQALPKGAPAFTVTPGPAPTKLVVKDLKTGTGAVIKKTDKLTANYVGVACSTGQIFDSSYVHGGPQTFPLNQVIPGWTQGIPGMKVGGVRVLGIPSALGYGSTAGGPGIAPDESLWFVVAPTKIG